MTDFNQKTHDTDVGSHGGQPRQMMEVFENQEFGSIRLLQEAGKTFFCASDVAKAAAWSPRCQDRSSYGRTTRSAPLIFSTMTYMFVTSPTASFSLRS